MNGNFIQRGRLRLAAVWLAALMPAALLFQGCDSSGNNSAPPASAPEPSYQAEVPLVTLKHWQNSTPGERYSFLIGFITMLELEKEWQGRIGGEILPFEKSLARSWTTGFANRPLTEIYNGLNRYVAEHPAELDRPAAEVMWFIFVQPRLKDSNSPGEAEKAPEPAQGGSENSPVLSEQGDEGV